MAEPGDFENRHDIFLAQRMVRRKRRVNWDNEGACDGAKLIKSLSRRYFQVPENRLATVWWR